MIDLLASTPFAAEITSALRRKPRRPVLPPLDAPEWRAAAQKPVVQGWMKVVAELAEKDASEPMPPLTDAMYAIFHATGERRTFEDVYFERRRRLARIAMTVIFGDAAVREKFIPKLIGKIEETMAEESWTFPAHSGQPSGKDPMKIDLFCAETANLMGELFSVFGAVLPTPLVQRIRERLRIQIFENYLKNHATMMWTSMTNNWNAVCHQGVIGAALALETDLDVIGRILAIAAPCLRLFLTGFGADGASSEGPGYWTYGFGRFAELNCQLETVTCGEFSVIGDNPKVRKVAAFAPAMTFSGGHLVNFADGPHKARLNAALLDYLGRRLQMPALLEESAAIFRVQTEEGVGNHGQRCDFFFYTRCFLRCPGDLGSAKEPARADVYFPDYGAVVARGTDARGNLWEFAAKGGHNEEHHNHNDCGSFLLNFNSHPAFIEIGAPEYVRDFFRLEHRYKFLAARSLGHSVPLVNGVEQHVGRQFAATILDCQLTADRVTFVVDLTRAYPSDAKCRKLIRTFTFEKSAGCLKVEDAYELDGPGIVESILICHAPVAHETSSATIHALGGNLRVSIGEGASLAKKIDVEDYRIHRGSAQKLHRLRIVPHHPVSDGAILLEITVASVQPSRPT